MVAPVDQIEAVIASLRQAATANLKTACREGNVICLDEQRADDVLVSADLHGNRVNFERLLRIADLDNATRRHIVMQEVCHGGPTYPTGDGGCMSHLLLEDIAALKNSYPDRVHFILSNHELAELTDFPIMKASRMLNLSFRTGMQELYGSAVEDVRAAYSDFLRTCPLAVRLASGIFVCHSAPANTDRDGFDTDVLQQTLKESDFGPHTPLFKLVWGRDFREENARAFAKLVDAELLIHGHEPCADGFRVPNSRQIILDCCGDEARYVLLPTGTQLSQQDVIDRIERL
jgi:hypothetical protein